MSEQDPSPKATPNPEAASSAAEPETPAVPTLPPSQPAASPAPTEGAAKPAAIAPQAPAPTGEGTASAAPARGEEAPAASPMAATPVLETSVAPELSAAPAASAETIEEEERAQAEAADRAVLAESRRQTRRAFVVAAVGAAAGYGFYRWIDRSPDVEMQPAPLRDAFRLNAKIARGIFRDRALAPTYPLADARDLRVNGVYGLKKMLAPDSWRLQLVGVRGDRADPRFTPDVTAWEYRYVDGESHEDQGHDTKIDPNARTSEKMAPKSMLSQAKAEEERTVRMPRGREEAGESYSTLMPQTPGLLLPMEDILKLPRYELVTQFKCIEGWSEIVHWAGVRMQDFLEAYPPAPIDGREPDYVYMETPDGDYYTGYDMNVCRHPQTLLVTEMMGAPLTQFHGAPLRLHMPTKYGYKQIKRIGLISYTNRKPDDYWTKLGYDWYAGL